MGIFDSLLQRTISSTVASGQAKLAEFSGTVTARLSSTAVGGISRVVSSIPRVDSFGLNPVADVFSPAARAQRDFTAQLNLDRLARSEAQAQAGALQQPSPATDESHKVKLRRISGGDEDTAGLSIVAFDVMPQVTESRTVQYEPVAPPQFPGAFQKYKGTDSVQWTINATLISRTTEEATRNLDLLNTLRGWTMPYFGSNTGNRYKQQLGAPPPVLEFSGFRSGMIGPVPVVITSLNWDFPREVDYLPTTRNDGRGNVTPFPSVMQVSILVVESFSTQQFNRFSLQDYRRGSFDLAFSSNTGETGININEARARSNESGTVEAEREAQEIARRAPGRAANARQAQEIARRAPGRAAVGSNPTSLGAVGRSITQEFSNTQVDLEAAATLMNGTPQ